MRKQLKKNVAPLLTHGLLPFLIFLAACNSGEIQPVTVESGDMCSFCKMAISEKQFAAEIIAEDEKVLKFDDLGCLLRYRQMAGNQLKPAATFVTDYNLRQWIKAQNAFFVHSKSVKTPMNGGILAFADKAEAEREASNSQTQVQRFDELSAP
jgi:copper chaperone NosL